MRNGEKRQEEERSDRTNLENAIANAFAIKFLSFFTNICIRFIKIFVRRRSQLLQHMYNFKFQYI